MVEEGCSVNGRIWNNANKSFVPIFSIKPFKLMQDQILSRSRKLETHNFNGDNIYFLYFNVR